MNKKLKQSFINNADKNKFIDWVEEIATKYRNRGLSDWCKHCKYDKMEKPRNEDDFLQRIREYYTECDPDKIEVLLKLMTDAQKGSREYTSLVDRLLRELKSDMNSNRGWQPVKVDVLQLLYVHHPNRDVRLTGLEILISHGMGSGTSDDIGYKICEEVGGCEFVFTSYLNAQDAEGYLKSRPTCPVHGTLFYTQQDKENLWRRWSKLTEQYPLIKSRKN